MDRLWERVQTALLLVAVVFLNSCIRKTRSTEELCYSSSQPDPPNVPTTATRAFPRLVIRHPQWPLATCAAASALLNHSATTKTVSALEARFVVDLFWGIRNK